MNSGHKGDSAGVRDDVRMKLAAAYDAHGASVYRLAVMILADRSGAEDAVQQAFAKLAGMGDRVGRIESVQGYLRSAVRNECYRILERGRVRQRHESAAALLEPVEAQLDDADERAAIGQALALLPPDQREVVHMKVYEQLTFQQIADELSISINTAASRWRYAMEKLRVSLAEYASDEGHDERRTR